LGEKVFLNLWECVEIFPSGEHFLFKHEVTKKIGADDGQSIFLPLAHSPSSSPLFPQTAKEC
jgi:hypothetical protein